jgi:hypothetical protein
MRQRSGGLRFEASPAKLFTRSYFKNSLHKIELVEWLKVQTLSSNPSTTKKEGRKEGEREGGKEGGREGGRKRRKENVKLGVVVHACNPSTQKAEAGGL